MIANGEGNNTNAVGRQYSHKDIYLITNLINNKRYVGQSIDCHRRFSQHKAVAGKDHHSALHGAMQKYGTENFQMEILEEHVANYNEREQYWINHYNTLVPNGYNIMRGGSNTYIPTKYRRQFNDDQYYQIVDDIINRTLSWETIAHKWNTAPSLIREINKGRQYWHDDIEYPIRDNAHLWGIFQTPAAIEKVHQEILQGKTFMELAEKYECDKRVIVKLNKGDIKNYRLPNYTYPLVDVQKIYLTNVEVKQIQQDLMQNNITLKEIAKNHGATYSQVCNINNGLYYRDTTLQYPLKTELERTRYSEQDINRIIELLRQGLSSKTIIEQYPQYSERTIIRINNGNGIYYRSDIKYPIRLKNATINRITLEEIQTLLLHSNKSLRQIASQFNVNLSLIHHVNNGSKKCYRDEHLNYPLRKY